jgi:hypothetical protein
MLNDAFYFIVMLSVDFISIIILSVVMLDISMLSVMAPVKVVQQKRSSLLP